MEPAITAMIAKTALAVGTNKKVRTGIASVLAGIYIPFIFAILCILSLGDAAADHNREAVRLAFHGGNIPITMPADYREYIRKMQQSFTQIDAAMDGIDAITEGTVPDRYLVKAVFYSLYFGGDWSQFTESDYQIFAESFVNFEERTRMVMHEDGTQSEEIYEAAIVITDRMELYERLKHHYGVEATYEQQSNAVNVWQLAKENTIACQEEAVFFDAECICFVLEKEEI